MPNELFLLHKYKPAEAVEMQCNLTVLKNLKIGAKVLARRSKAMWNVLLATEQESKQLTGSILISMTLRIETEYIGTLSYSLWGARGHNRVSNGGLFCQIRKSRGVRGRN